MVVLIARCRNGVIELQEPLPEEFEGQKIQVQTEKIEPVEAAESVAESVRVAAIAPNTMYRQAGSLAGQIWMSPDFDEPLEDFAEYV